MSARTWSRLLGALGVSLLLLNGSGMTARGQQSSVRIVSSMPRTGAYRAPTDSIVNSITMALEEVGYQAGGIAVAYDDLDDSDPATRAWSRQAELDNATRTADDPSVVAYLGPFNSGAARVSIPVLNHAGLVMVSPVATYPGLTRGVLGMAQDEPDRYYPTAVRNFARTVPADDWQGIAGAKWAKQLGARRVAAVIANEAYGESLGAVFVNSARSLGLEVSIATSITGREPDYQALAGRLKSARPDLVYFAGITQDNAGRLFKDLRAGLGPDVKLMGPDGIYEDAFIEAAGPAAEGVYATFGAAPPDKLTGAGADWRQAYVDRFGSQPEAYASYGYDAARVVLNAIAAAGTADRSAIRDAVMATTDFDGLVGTWSFDANGDVTASQMSGRQIKNGRFDEANAILIPVP